MTYDVIPLSEVPSPTVRLLTDSARPAADSRSLLTTAGDAGGTALVTYDVVPMSERLGLLEFVQVGYFILCVIYAFTCVHACAGVGTCDWVLCVLS